ncbi:MAG: imm11 family protein [Rhodomicrobium sp.]
MIQQNTSQPDGGGNPVIKKTRKPRPNPKKRNFFKFSASWRSAVPNYRLVNEDRYDVHLLGRGELNVNPEPAIFEFGPKCAGKRPVRDFEKFWAGVYLVSSSSRDVFLAVEPEAFVFEKCVVQMKNGSEPPDYWLCHVKTVLIALKDPEKTSVSISDNLSELLLPTFFEDVLPKHHVFRLKHSPFTLYCDDVLRDAVHAAELTNFQFEFLKSVEKK